MKVDKMNFFKRHIREGKEIKSIENTLVPVEGMLTDQFGEEVWINRDFVKVGGKNYNISYPEWIDILEKARPNKKITFKGERATPIQHVFTYYCLALMIEKEQI